MRRFALICVGVLLLNGAAAHAQDAPPTACDNYAAFPLDPQRKAVGVLEEKNIDPALAIPACLSALQRYPRSPRLKYQLGRAYFAAHNVRDAISFFKQAAQSGYAPAEASLGYLSQAGEVIPQNYRDANFWYSKAANHGYAPAQNNLGSLYENGLGVSKNLETAIAWYRKAAEQGFAPAQQKLTRLEQAEITRKQGEQREAQEAARKQEEQRATQELVRKGEEEAARTKKIVQEEWKAREAQEQQEQQQAKQQQYNEVKATYDKDVIAQVLNYISTGKDEGELNNYWRQTSPCVYENLAGLLRVPVSPLDLNKLNHAEIEFYVEEGIAKDPGFSTSRNPVYGTYEIGRAHV